MTEIIDYQQLLSLRDQFKFSSIYGREFVLFEGDIEYDQHTGIILSIFRHDPFVNYFTVKYLRANGDTVKLYINGSWALHLK